jgi:hypothetical protein
MRCKPFSDDETNHEQAAPSVEMDTPLGRVLFTFKDPEPTRRDINRAHGSVSEQPFARATGEAKVNGQLVTFMFDIVRATQYDNDRNKDEQTGEVYARAEYAGYSRFERPDHRTVTDNAKNKIRDTLAPLALELVTQRPHLLAEARRVSLENRAASKADEANRKMQDVAELERERAELLALAEAATRYTFPAKTYREATRER